MNVQNEKPKLMKLAVYAVIGLSVVSFMFYLLAWAGEPSNIATLIRGVLQVVGMICLALGILEDKRNKKRSKVLFYTAIISFICLVALLFI